MLESQAFASALLLLHVLSNKAPGVLTFDGDRNTIIQGSS